MSTTIKKTQGLQQAYEGSYYTIIGTGGDLDEWVAGYEESMGREKIGKPKAWYTAKGHEVNAFIGVHMGPHAFNPDVTFLLFPLDGLNVGKLALFKLAMQDRWFDDIVDNTRRHHEQYMS